MLNTAGVSEIKKSVRFNTTFIFDDTYRKCDYFCQNMIIF